jgi:lipopolysaccharide transport protein LptA
MRSRHAERCARLVPGALALCAFASCGAPAGAAESGDDKATVENCRDPLCLNASHMELTPNHVVLHEFDIVDTTRGITHVKGDLADGTGRDFKNSTWVLTGHVEVTLPQGHLSAERASMQTVNNRITMMTAQGSPAQFESAGDAAAPNAPKASVAAAIKHARGHANEIIYNLEHGELQLDGDSWLSDGCNEISSQHISYDIASQKVHAETNPGGKDKVHITSTRTAPGCGSEADKQ